MPGNRSHVIENEADSKRRAELWAAPRMTRSEIGPRADVRPTLP